MYFVMHHVEYWCMGLLVCVNLLVQACHTCMTGVHYARNEEQLEAGQKYVTVSVVEQTFVCFRSMFI